MRGRRLGWMAVTAVLVALAAAPAHAAYPGANGRIAFVSSGTIWTVNPDGSGAVQVTSPASPLTDNNPSWSPDGTRIAFDRGQASTRDLYLINADGTGEMLVATPGRDPTWSPDASEIAFIDCCAIDGPDALYRVNADGTNRHFEGDVTSITDYPASDPAWSPTGAPFAFSGIFNDIICDPFDPGPGSCDAVNNKFLAWRMPGWTCDECYQDFSVPGSYPDWSPSGTDFVYTTARIRQDYYTFSGTDGEIAAVDADGTSNGRTLVAGPEIDEQPAWSPDGTKVVFRRSSGASAGLWVVGADGSSPTPIYAGGSQPDWQPVQQGSPRPVGTGPHRTSLVTAFEQCSAPNREHGPPLAHPSCNPPDPVSPNLVVSAGEVRAHSVGFVRFGSIVGTPGGPDDADIRLRLKINNVMNSSDLSDYTGIVRPEVVVRLTDRDGFQRQTTQDFPFGFDVPCAATASTIEGGICDITTTADTIVPGSAAEGTRAIWAFDQVKVYDGGPAGDGTDASLFAVQGIFIP